MTFNFLVFLVLQVFQPLFMRFSVGTRLFAQMFQVFHEACQIAGSVPADGTRPNTTFSHVFRPESKHWRGLNTWHTWNTANDEGMQPWCRKTHRASHQSPVQLPAQLGIATQENAHG